MTAPFPDRCPHCGTEHPPYESLEVVNGYASILFDGETAQWGGGTEMDWNSTATTEYRYACCGVPVSEEIARALDRMLGNVRYDVTFEEHTP